MTVQAANTSSSAARRALTCTDADVELERLRRDRVGKGNDVRENEPPSKHVWMLPKLQTVLEQQSVAVFLMIANLIENPLLCVREQTIQTRGAGAPFPGSAVNSKKRGRGGLKEGRKEDWSRRNKKYAKKSNRAQIWMAGGRGVTDWTE